MCRDESVTLFGTGILVTGNRWPPSRMKDRSIKYPRINLQALMWHEKIRRKTEGKPYLMLLPRMSNECHFNSLKVQNWKCVLWYVPFLAQMWLKIWKTPSFNSNTQKLMLLKLFKLMSEIKVAPNIFSSLEPFLFNEIIDPLCNNHWRYHLKDELLLNKFCPLPSCKWLPWQREILWKNALYFGFWRL